MSELLIPTLPSLLAQPGLPFIHRDLSWLHFNERVLMEALTTSIPVLERMKFLGITATNLDEFFMIRFAALIKKKPEEQSEVARIRNTLIEEVVKFGVQQRETLDILTSELDVQRVRIVSDSEEEEDELAVGRDLFLSQIFPELPVGDRFVPSRISQLESLQMGAIVGGEHWVPIPKHLEPVYLIRAPEPGAQDDLRTDPTLPPAEYFLFFLDDLLAAHLADALGMSGKEVTVVRLTRDGDVSLDIDLSDVEAIPEHIRRAVGSRQRGRPMRLEVRGALPESALMHAVSPGPGGMRLSHVQIITAASPIGLYGLRDISSKLSKIRPDLTYPPAKPHVPSAIVSKAGVFDSLRHGDALLQHPFDSFDGFLKFLEAAANDPQVRSIQQTIYRMDPFESVETSPMLRLFKIAVQNGKRVRVLVELRARFDELNNLKIADELRRMGVEVGFGLPKLKLHAKVVLVTREEGEGSERHYTHLSTGNYHARNARSYVDLALLTANEEIGADAKLFFDSVFQGKVPTQFKRLVPAPTALHKRVMALVHAESEAARAGKPARIVAKTNSLVEDALIQELYSASQAGVQIDLIVRGACSLVPGVKGLSENIRVISVVDRYLEHSRLYYFQNSKQMYLSSADWMQRNFFSRLELAFPILDERIYRYLEQVLIPAYVGDTVKARELTAQGTWKRRNAVSVRNELKALDSPLFDGRPTRAQFFIQSLAERDYRGTPLEGIS